MKGRGTRHPEFGVGDTNVNCPSPRFCRVSKFQATIWTQNIILSTKSNVASTLLPFLATMLNEFSSFCSTKSKKIEHVQFVSTLSKGRNFVRHCCQNRQHCCRNRQYCCPKRSVLSRHPRFGGKYEPALEGRCWEYGGCAPSGVQGQSPWSGGLAPRSWKLFTAYVYHHHVHRLNISRQSPADWTALCYWDEPVLASAAATTGVCWRKLKLTCSGYIADWSIAIISESCKTDNHNKTIFRIY